VHKGGHCKDGWTFFPHPSYSHDLAPSDFHLFGALKDAVRGRRFAEDGEMKHNVREEHRRFSKDIYATVMQRLRETRKNDADNEGDCGKINSNFNVTVITVSVKKNRKHDFLTGPRKIVRPSGSTLKYLCS
jgi:hypothetical protein